MKIKKKDYDLVDRISLSYAKKLNIANKELSDKELSRLGFYYLGLNLVLGDHNPLETSEKIIDSSFQAKVNNKANNDFGIDAIDIDREEKKVKLFSFKYRDSFKTGETKTSNELTSTAPFLGLLKKSDRPLENEDKAPLTINFLKDIIEFNDSDNVDFELYLLSNDVATFDEEDVAVEEFKDNYSWVNIHELNLNDIVDFISIKPNKNEAKLFIDQKELLQHDIDGYTTANSYVAKVQITDLVKITSKEYKIRDLEHLEDEELLKNQKIDLNILFDNVRGYLGDTDYNAKIIKTLEQEPEKFFLFNNGITITADHVTVRSVKMDRSYEISMNNYQIVNGGQTLRTIYSFISNHGDQIKNLAHGSVLVRIFQTGLEAGLVNKVSEYTNSQNAISGRDLRSVDKIQLDIENRFKTENIKYIRKINKVDDEQDDDYRYKINMEKLGQLILAYKGHPEKVSNSKRKIFDQFYSTLFNDSPEFMDMAIELVKEYDSIQAEYIKLIDTYKFYEQKIFYIIYLHRWVQKNTLMDNIKILEENLSDFRKDEEISPARKLIQTAFKQKIDSNIESITGNSPSVITFK